MIYFVEVNGYSDSFNSEYLVFAVAFPGIILRILFREDFLAWLNSEIF